MNHLTTLKQAYIRIRAGVHGDPVRDWLVLISLAALAFVVVMVWNIWHFNVLQKDEANFSPSIQATQESSREIINSLNKVLDARAGEQSKYISGEYHYTDPSL